MNTNISINNNFKIFDDYILINSRISGLRNQKELLSIYIQIDFLLTSKSIVFKSPDNDEVIEVICITDKASDLSLRGLACRLIIEFYEK